MAAMKPKFACCAAMLAWLLFAQGQPAAGQSVTGQPAAMGEVSVRIGYPQAKPSAKLPPAVVWLAPVAPGTIAAAKPGRYTLLQKNRAFSPHLLIIPVGSTVSFPNADPFFHNVFSLFNGKRFDLGLYEAGSTREVVFPREGVSYIFCNIHAEMSAVVLSLSTPLYATADASYNARIRNVPAGDYDLHVWVEGTPEPTLKNISKRVHVRPGSPDVTTIELPEPPSPLHEHLNKFGQSYDHDARPHY